MGKEVLTPSSFLTLELDCREDRIQVTGQGGKDTGNRTAGRTGYR